MRTYFYFIISIGFIYSLNKNISELPKQAVISFVFDDLNKSDSSVKAIFDEFNFKPSFAIVSSKLEPKTALLYKSYSENGISILSHSHTHLNMTNSKTVSKESVAMEMKMSKEIIESYGIPVSGFVTPYSLLASDFLGLLNSEYDYAFTNNNNDIFDESVNKYHLSRYGIESNISTSNHSIDEIKARINRSIDNGELLVIYGHALPSRYLDDYGNSRFNSDDLRTILTYLKIKVNNKECLVLTSDLAVKEYYK